MKKILIAIVLLIILGGFFGYRVKIKNLFLDLNKEKLPLAVEYQAANIKTNFTNELPTSFNLGIPFTPQAPTANWDATFKEACEEASIMMIDRFYQQTDFASGTETEKEILKMVDWQMNNFGGHFDLTASQTAEMIKSYLGYQKVEIIDKPTIAEIKNHLAESHPVIVPAAGQLLNNPYFRQPGPIYHMLVIKGYAKDKFITNDPGTKRGQDYLYDYQIIMDAMHDWNENDIRQGAKRVIVIYPN